MQHEDALWSVEDVAAYLRVPVGSVYKMTAKSARTTIPHVKLGNLLRFRKADIDRWLDLAHVVDEALGAVQLLAVSNLETLDKANRAAARYRR